MILNSKSHAVEIGNIRRAITIVQELSGLKAISTRLLQEESNASLKGVELLREGRHPGLKAFLS